MNIYVTHASSYDFKHELYIPIRHSALNQNHRITLPHENSSAPFSSAEFIKQCDLILAEVSYPSTGQGIELGWANVYRVPIICIHKKGTIPSSSLKVISNSFIEYESSKDMIQKLISAIQHINSPHV